MDNGNGNEVHYTNLEKALLDRLRREPGEVVSHWTLLTEVWKKSYPDNSDPTVRVHVSRVRKKLSQTKGAGSIKTIAWRGYLWIEPQPTTTPETE